MCPPLAYQLIRHATGTHFTTTIEIVGQMLLKILAVPAEAHQLRLAFFKDCMEPVRDGCFTKPPGPSFPSAERGQIISADKSCHPMQGLVVSIPLIILQNSAGIATGSFRISINQILDRMLYVRPVLLEEGIVRMIQGLAVGLENTTGMAIREWILAGWMQGRWDFGAIVDAPVAALLMFEIDPPHLFFQARKKAGKALLISPHVRAGRIATSIGPFPSINVSIGDSENDPDMAENGGLGRETIQQPIGKRAVIKGLAEFLGSFAERDQVCGCVSGDGACIGPNRGIMAADCALIFAVLVRIMPCQDERHFSGFTRGQANGMGHSPVIRPAHFCRRTGRGLVQGSEATLGAKLSPRLTPIFKCTQNRGARAERGQR